MLIVEDGTGIADANSYADMAFIDDYHAARGNVAWAEASPSDRESAAINATDYLGSYDGRLAGWRTFPHQMLAWPRSEVYLDGGRYMVSPVSVPVEVRKAQAELALPALAGPLQPALARGGAVKRRVVGPLETEWFEGATATTSYPTVDMLLAPFMGSVGSIALARS